MAQESFLNAKIYGDLQEIDSIAGGSKSKGTPPIGKTCNRWQEFKEIIDHIKHKTLLEFITLERRAEMLLESSKAQTQTKIERRRGSKSVIPPQKKVGSLSGVQKNAIPWVPDDQCDSCQLCRSKFHLLTRRRHHCRLCGSLACYECIDKHFLDSANKVSVLACKACLKKMESANNIQKTQTPTQLSLCYNEILKCERNLKELRTRLENSNFFSYDSSPEAVDQSVKYANISNMYYNNLKSLGSIWRKIQDLSERETPQRRKIYLCVRKVIDECVKRGTLARMSIPKSKRECKMLPNDHSSERYAELVRLEEELGALNEQYGQLGGRISDAIDGRRFYDVEILKDNQMQISRKIFENIEKISAL